jgi:Acetyltransferase (GNAT) family
MPLSSRRFTAERVRDQGGRRDVVGILRATYRDEKHWVRDAETQFDADDAGRQDMSWFVARAARRPAGVLRVFYDPPLAAYANYQFTLLDSSIRVEDFIAANRIAEIGRFAVLPRYRRDIMVAAELMRAATEDAVTRGCTHFITDVFEDDPHSPYGFHTRVIGFHPIATHDQGELDSRSRRITLILELKAAYNRMRRRPSWIYRYLTGRWDPAMHERLAA